MNKYIFILILIITIYSLNCNAENYGLLYYGETEPVIYTYNTAYNYKNTGDTFEYITYNDTGEWDTTANTADIIKKEKLYTVIYPENNQNKKIFLGNRFELYIIYNADKIIDIWVRRK